MWAWWRRKRQQRPEPPKEETLEMLEMDPVIQDQFTSVRQLLATLDEAGQEERAVLTTSTPKPSESRFVEGVLSRVWAESSAPARREPVAVGR